MGCVAQTDGPSGSQHRDQLSAVKPSGQGAAGGGRQDRWSRGEPEQRPDACLPAAPAAPERHACQKKNLIWDKLRVSTRAEEIVLDAPAALGTFVVVKMFESLRSCCALINHPCDIC